jgi:hypothetical protein
MATTHPPEGITAYHESRATMILVILFCGMSMALLFLPTIRFVALLLLLFFAPGFLLERAWPAALPSFPFLRPALWLGLSLSSITILYEWASLVNLSLNTPVLLLLAMLCLVGVVWHLRQPLSVLLTLPWDERLQRLAPAPWLAMLAILLLTLWNRFAQIEPLLLPAWVDPVHHALMIRIAAETGQVPSSLQPYLPVDALPYHWGYHVITATLLKLSALPLPQVMLWEGQILNALHILPCAALATYFWRSPLAGLGAALVVGTIAIMPSYYVSWGRYTHLTGLLLLPPVAIAWHSLLCAPLRNHIIHTALLLAGLSMIHILVLLLTLSLLATITALWALTQAWPASLVRLKAPLASSALALVLALPWLWFLFQHMILAVVEKPETIVSGGGYVAFNTSLLWTRKNDVLIALALIVALWGFGRRAGAALLPIVWVGLLLLLANPWTLGYFLTCVGALVLLWALRNQHYLVATSTVILLLLLHPWSRPIHHTWLLTNDIIIISLFVPISLLLGGGLTLLVQRIVALRPRRWLFYPALALCALLLSGAALRGTYDLRNVVNQQTILIKPADLPALDWIATHTPPDARFLIRSAGWYPDAHRGTDGGYWIMPLTGRWTSTPPALFTHADPAYVAKIASITAITTNYEPGQEEVLYDLIRQHNITHVYLSDRSAPMTVQTFRGIPHDIVYQQDGITILEIRSVPEERQMP